MLDANGDGAAWCTWRVVTGTGVGSFDGPAVGSAELDGGGGENTGFSIDIDLGLSTTPPCVGDVGSGLLHSRLRLLRACDCPCWKSVGSSSRNCLRPNAWRGGDEAMGWCPCGEPSREGNASTVVYLTREGKSLERGGKRVDGHVPATDGGGLGRKDVGESTSAAAAAADSGSDGGRCGAACQGGLKNESLRDFFEVGVMRGAGAGAGGIRGVISASGAIKGAACNGGGRDVGDENGEAKNAFVLTPLEEDCSLAEDGECWSPWSDDVDESAEDMDDVVVRMLKCDERAEDDPDEYDEEGPIPKP